MEGLERNVSNSEALHGFRKDFRLFPVKTKLGFLSLIIEVGFFFKISYEAENFFIWLLILSLAVQLFICELSTLILCR